VDRRARLSFSGHVLAIKGTIRQVVLAVRASVQEWVREWLRALAVRCIRRGRFRAERAEVREDRALLRGRALARHALGLGIVQELLRAA
jgi:hypothetical protein